MDGHERAAGADPARPDAAPPPPTAQPQHGARPFLPLGVALVALLVVAGSALSAPWRADPRSPAPLPAPEPPLPEAPEQLTDLTAPGEVVPDERSFPLLLVLTVVGLLVLLLLLRVFLNRLSLARGSAVDRYEPSAGAVTAVAGPPPEPDLPALRRGVAAARQVLRGAADPGDAVIAAWLELEKAAASSGIDRAPAQTPTEFTAAVLAATRADPGATRTLLGLYHRARFDPHAALTSADTAEAGRCLERIAASWAER